MRFIILPVLGIAAEFHPEPSVRKFSQEGLVAITVLELGFLFARWMGYV